MTIEWIDKTTPKEQEIEISFHGGEPLLVGLNWFKNTLALMRHRFGERIRFSIQSNLWALKYEFCSLFREFGVSIGTSLDGPKKINDKQRGQGYYNKTMKGIETAQRSGLSIGIICTFTKLSLNYWREVFDFFASHSLSFSVHGAVKQLDCNNRTSWTLSCKENTDIFIQLFDHYLDNIHKVQIPNFDNIAKSISSDKSYICTFTNCLGNYFTISANGRIFSCNRFANFNNWQLGSIQDLPSIKDLQQSQVWNKLHNRELIINNECGDCQHFNYCKGGCSYNAVAGELGNRDHNCEFYKKFFDYF